jgi:hypothetical protein
MALLVKFSVKQQSLLITTAFHGQFIAALKLHGLAQAKKPQKLLDTT